jgi:hypothetical protein
MLMVNLYFLNFFFRILCSVETCTVPNMSSDDGKGQLRKAGQTRPSVKDNKNEITERPAEEMRSKTLPTKM